MKEKISSRLDARWLHEGGVPRLLTALNRDGEEARVIGGAVRDALLGEPVREIDIATTAAPEEVERRALAAGFKAVPTGLKHGTLTVVIDGEPFEVTTLRADVETYGRHAKVEFTRDWKGDAERRDLTINALSAGPDGTVYDYVGGLFDLAARKVRFIGEPRRRIDEDYLRILRFFRFHAVYGRGELDAAGLAACIAARGGLERLSRERIRTELIKLLLARGASPVLQVMTDAGLLGPLLAGVPNVAHFTAMAEIEAALQLQPDAMRRLAALAVMVAEDAGRLSYRLRLSNVEQQQLLSMAQVWWRRIAPAGDRLARPWLYRLGPGYFTDRVLLAWARWGAPAGASNWRELASLPQRWTAPVFPLKAADLIARGVEKGPRLGAALEAAEDAWIAADFPMGRAEIDAIADRAARS